MKKNIISLLTTVAISSTMCLSAFANSGEIVTRNINDNITLSISNEAIKNINVDNVDCYNINKEENSIDYYNKDNNIKFIFNEEINLNDKVTAYNMIEAITNDNEISVMHEHNWKLVGTWESESGASGPLYYCEGCGTMLLG